MRTAVKSLLVILLVTAAPGVSEAGNFVLTNIYMKKQASTISPQTTRVMVGAYAEYDGEPDPADDTYSLRTILHSGNETFNNGVSESGGDIWAGMLIHVVAEEKGSYGDLYHCSPDGLDRTYTGEAHVKVLHVHWGYESSQGFVGPEYLTCEESNDEAPRDDGGSTDEESAGEATPTISPILVNLDRGDFRLSSLEDGVSFDLDDDGEPERVAWTTADSGDAWLVLDRNGNGTIDSGREMFGNVTPQPETPEPNGYLALAVFDTPEQMGNEDGIIDARDLIFSSLRLWIDENRDGVSQPWELWRLEEHEVRSLALDYITSRRRDRHGNEFRYSSLVGLERGTTQAVDVFPLVEE